MRIPVWLTLASALVTLGVVIIIGMALIQPNVPLIRHAEFKHDRITPNADGDSDITEFSYSLSRTARITLALEDYSGNRYAFREDEGRAAQDYSVLFSGVVDGFVLPGEEFAGEIQRRLLPNGRYTWRLQAVGQEREETDERTGVFVIEEADLPLPEISIFTVAPETFTPNQDGIDDRVQINVFLEKESELSVYLLDSDGTRIFIPEVKEGRQPGEAGRHSFDYEAGVDRNADPPTDGRYTLVAEAQDDEGQRVQRTANLTIEAGGKPLAEIVPQTAGVDVVFAVQPYDETYYSDAEQPGARVRIPDNPQDLSLTTLTIPLGDMLVFKLTVENYSRVPIRTTGPPPGTVYAQEQNAATLGWVEESGAWRIGIHCQTSSINNPWRWAIGTDDDLIVEFDPNTGQEHHYLPPGQRAVVWGAIRMTEIEARNPQNCGANLIHEDVEISVRNSNVGTRQVELVAP